MGDTDAKDYDFSIEAQGLPPEAVVVAMTTAPDMLLAKYLAHDLVEEGVVACANLGAPGLSMYMWQGEIQGDEDVMLTFKTTVAQLPELGRRLRQRHPYVLPSLLVLPVAGGYQASQDWVREQASPKAR